MLGAAGTSSAARFHGYLDTVEAARPHRPENITILPGPMQSPSHIIPGSPMADIARNLLESQASHQHIDGHPHLNAPTLRERTRRIKSRRRHTALTGQRLKRRPTRSPLNRTAPQTSHKTMTARTLLRRQSSNRAINSAIHNRPDKRSALNSRIAQIRVKEK